MKNRLFLYQIGSYILTFLVYAGLLNWKIALLLMFGVGFHEYCHLLAAKFRGFQTSGFFLIPFVGGMALINGPFPKRWDNAIVALAGPLGGGSLAIFTGIISVVCHLPTLTAASMWMLVLNLFNLLPISFMDGGQIMGTITYSISRKVGLIAKATSLVLGLIILWKIGGAGVLLFIGFFGGQELVSEYKNYKALQAGQRWLVSDSYLYPPKPLNKKQATTIIGSYLFSIGIMLMCLIYLTKHMTNNMSSIFN